MLSDGGTLPTPALANLVKRCKAEKEGAAAPSAGAEAEFAKLLPIGGAYYFKTGKLFNLEAGSFIKDHGNAGEKEPVEWCA